MARLLTGWNKLLMSNIKNDRFLNLFFAQAAPEYTTALALVRMGLGVTMIPESFWNDRFAGTYNKRC